MQEQKELLSLREKAELLGKIGIQLTVIAEGRDAQLNAVLKQLRATLREESGLAALSQAADALCKHVLVDKNDEPLGSTIGVMIAAAIEELLASVAFPAKAQFEINNLCEQLKTTNTVVDALLLLREVVGEVRAAKVSEKEVIGETVWCLFDAKAEDPAVAAQQLQRFVANCKELTVELLEHIATLAEEQPRIIALKGELLAATQIGHLDHILQETLDILMALIEEVRVERRQAEKYLKRLAEQLRAVEDDISAAFDLSRLSLERAERLAAQMGAEISGLEKTLRTDLDLQTFPTAVADRIKTLNRQLSNHVQLEQGFYEQTADRVRGLTRQVRELEYEANELRPRLTKAAGDEGCADRGV